MSPELSITPIVNSEGAESTINGANAIVIRTIPGTTIRRGFAVTIKSSSDAKIYNDGIARGESATQINARIARQRATSGESDGEFRIGDMRRTRGTAFASRRLDDDGPGWLRRGNAPIPGQVAARLNGREFGTFDRFREQFWMTVAATPELAAGFRGANLTRMRNGRAPFVPSVERHGEQVTFVIHHPDQIRHGGPVYDMSNMGVVTPRIHNEIHHGRR